MIRVVHYINQFFGQIGGEDRAGVPPTMVKGPIGPGLLLNSIVKDHGEVVATVICGDNYFSENKRDAVEALLNLIASQKPDLFLAGPAFHAGRYGLACGEICKRVREKLSIPVITGMYPENPGAELYRKDVFIIETANNAVGMRKAMPRMVEIALKILRGGPIGTSSEEGYLPQGIKKNILSDKLASQRSVELLLKKILGEPFQTEIPAPNLNLVEAASPIEDLPEARIALVTEGGLYPLGNPDNMPNARSTWYAKYHIAELEELDPALFVSIHRGFDTTFINEDPNRLLPLDILREMEREGSIKEIYPEYFVTTGVATTMDNGKRIGASIAQELKEGGCDGAIVTAT